MKTEDRIRQRMAELSLKQKDIISATGASRGTVSQWVNGIAQPNGDYLVKLAECLHTSEKWLRTGEGIAEDSGKYHSNVSPAMEVKGQVPIISWVIAGIWTEAVMQSLSEEDTEFIPCPRAHSSDTYALRVEGESMRSPTGRSYPDGIIIFVDPQLRCASPGQRIIAKLKNSDDVTFKQLASDGTKHYLMPLNPKFEPMFEEFEILGTVIGAYQPE